MRARNRFFRHGLVLVAVAAVLGIASGVARAESSFTIVALPDTQFYSESYPTTFTAQTNWIKNNQVGQNIVFVTHEGDIVDNYDNTTQWSNATSAMDNLNGVVRYATCPGNHDSDYGANYTNYAANFGSARYSTKPGFLATTATKNNCLAMTFTAGSRQFLSLSLDSFDASTSITFAQNQINAHLGMPTIVTLHSFYNTDGSFTGEGGQFWNNLFKVSGNSQIFMVLCGHKHGTFHDTDNDVDGKPVYEMLADYQSEGQGGDGYMRLITFDPDSSTIHVKSYSPVKDLYKTDAGNQFDYTGVDFSRLPEPATLSMLAIGVLTILRRARRAS